MILVIPRYSGEGIVLFKLAESILNSTWLHVGRPSNSIRPLSSPWKRTWIGGEFNPRTRWKNSRRRDFCKKSIWTIVFDGLHFLFTSFRPGRDEFSRDYSSFFVCCLDICEFYESDGVDSDSTMLTFE